MAMLRLIPGFRGRTFELWVLKKCVSNFYVRATPTQGSVIHWLFSPHSVAPSTLPHDQHQAKAGGGGLRERERERERQRDRERERDRETERESFIYEGNR